jgi:hypothetical protein
MQKPYRLKISKNIYHVGFGAGGSINSALKYSIHDMERVKESESSYYNMNRWKFVEIKDDGTMVEVS